MPFEHPLPFEPPPFKRSGGCPKYGPRHLAVQTVLCERQNRPVDDSSRAEEITHSSAENVERMLVGILTPVTERLGLLMKRLERWLDTRSTGESGSAGDEGFVPDLAPGMLTGELIEGPTRPGFE